MSYSVADLQSVHRAIADLRRGAAVLCRNNDGTSALIAAAEQVSPAVSTIWRGGLRHRLIC